MPLMYISIMLNQLRVEIMSKLPELLKSAFACVSVLEWLMPKVFIAYF